MIHPYYSFQYLAKQNNGSGQVDHWWHLSLQVVVSSLFSGVLSDRYGRRPTLLFLSTIHIISSFLTAFSSSSYYFFVSVRSVSSFWSTSSTIAYKVDPAGGSLYQFGDLPVRAVAMPQKSTQETGYQQQEEMCESGTMQLYRTTRQHNAWQGKTPRQTKKQTSGSILQKQTNKTSLKSTQRRHL